MKWHLRLLYHAVFIFGTHWCLCGDYMWSYTIRCQTGFSVKASWVHIKISWFWSFRQRLILHDLGHLVGLYLLISVPVSSSVQSLGFSVCGWLSWLTKGGCYLQIIVICVKVCLVVIGWNLCLENHCINVPRLEKNSWVTAIRHWTNVKVSDRWLINVDQRVFVMGCTSFKCFSSKLIEAKWQLCVLRN